MKIVFLLPGFSKKPVGGFRVVYEYANGLAERGHDVSLVYPRYLRNAPRSQKRKSFVPDILWRMIKEVFPSQPSWHQLDLRVRSIFIPNAEEKYMPHADIMILTAWWTMEIAQDLPDAHGRKIYFIQHYEDWDGAEDRVKKTWLLPFHKIVIAKWLYKKGRELGVPEQDMSYIPNGIDFKKYKLLKPMKDRSRSVLMMCHKLDWKGSADGIAALLKVREKIKDFEVVFFGVSPRPKSLPSWIEYRENPSQKELIEDLYNGSSIFLFPSWGEGWPLPPAEAMACGCALIGTSCTGIDEYAEDQKTALLSPVKNFETLAKNLERVLEDDALRVRLAEAGYRRIQDFEWEESVRKLEECIIRNS